MINTKRVLKHCPKVPESRQHILCMLIFKYTVKTHLKWHATIPGTGVIVAMPQYNGTHSLTRLVLHAILSESGPIRACHYTRDNTLVTL